MDALLRQLLRQQQANPFDADLARRLDAALLRGGGSDLVSSEPLLMHASAQGCLFDLCPQKELLDERIISYIVEWCDTPDCRKSL